MAQLCARCQNTVGGDTSRVGTQATLVIQWREAGDPPHWPNRVTVRCDRCYEDLLDWLQVPKAFRDKTPPYSQARGSIEKVVRI